jgi:glutathione S-transferase
VRYNIHSMLHSITRLLTAFSLSQINPNGRIPAMTDKFTDGKPIRVFESGSIMQYLVCHRETSQNQLIS